MEMARAYASAKTPPPRNVYFASVTAEEQNLLGSKYLGMHPPEPIRDFTLDLNFDELLPIGVPTSVVANGSERTSFYPVVEKTAAAFGLQIQPDRAPMAGIYYRSDHFSFARFGVPAFSIDEGTLFAGHTAEWGKRQKQDYDDQRYHRPTDEYEAKYGLPRRCQIGSVRVLTRVAGFVFGARNLEARETSLRLPESRV